MVAGGGFVFDQNALASDWLRRTGLSIRGWVTSAARHLAIDLCFGLSLVGFARIKFFLRFPNGVNVVILVPIWRLTDGFDHVANLLYGCVELSLKKQSVE